MEEEPASFAEAEKHACWRQAMMEEMDSMESNKTWRLVPLPHGHRPIGLKWVYKVKKDAAADVVRHKARLVAKGYVQQPGVDFDEVFAPVAPHRVRPAAPCTSCLGGVAGAPYGRKVRVPEWGTG
jgi:hypothetical protein